MGRNTGDFLDGGACARMDSHGAMQAVSNFDGPAGNHVSSADNDFAGHTASAPAYGGTS